MQSLRTLLWPPLTRFVSRSAAGTGLVPTCRGVCFRQAGWLPANRFVSAVLDAWLDVHRGHRFGDGYVAECGVNRVDCRRVELPVLVDALGLRPIVDTTVTSALVGAEKLNPRIFHYALQLAGAGDDVWMVGDNPVADIGGARAVGIRAIHVGDGRTLTDAAAEITAASRDSRSRSPASEASQ